MKSCIVLFVLAIWSISQVSAGLKGEFPKEAFDFYTNEEAWHPLMHKTNDGYEEVKRSHESFIQLADSKSFLKEDAKQRCQCRFVLDTNGIKRETDLKTEFKITTEKFRMKQKQEEKKEAKKEEEIPKEKKENKNAYYNNYMNGGLFSQMIPIPQQHPSFMPYMMPTQRQSYFLPYAPIY